jgi:hypothetical protein
MQPNILEQTLGHLFQKDGGHFVHDLLTSSAKYGLWLGLTITSAF